MSTNRRVNRESGFTLIEILVSLILVSLLVAAVFPVVTQQVGQADAPRLANDLVNVRSGMELFATNLRNRQAKGLDELVNLADLTGNDIGGSAYGTQHTSRWDGPYIDAAIAVGGSNIVSGFDAIVDNDFELYDIGGNATTLVPADAEFVSIFVSGLSASDFASLNDLVDGETDTATSSGFTGGKLRAPAASATAFYLAIPFSD